MLKQPFSSMWLYSNPRDCRYRPPEPCDIQLLSFDLADYDALCKLYYDISNSHASRLYIGRTPCRIQRVQTIAGISFVLRALKVSPRPLLDLGMPRGVRDILLQEEKIQGLILICGAQRSGKTTMAGSLVWERISTFGGAAQILEDPPEMDLDGFYNGGIIQQIDVQAAGYSLDPKDRLPVLAADAMRSDTDVLFFGEVRQPKDARAVIAMAAVGATVLTTIHSNDLETAIERLIDLASDGKESDQAAKMVANALYAVIHLQLGPKEIHTKDGAKSQQILNVRPCFFVGKFRDGLRGSVRKQNYAQHINNTAIDQERAIINGVNILG